jgi:DNA primase
MPAQYVNFKHVRERADFERVAGHYGLTLDGTGDQRTALCCFHEEKTGSLKIHLGKKIFHCFGCGAKGNVLDFVTLREGGNPDDKGDLRKGALVLADICGIDPDPRARKGRSQKVAPAERKAAGAETAETVPQALAGERRAAERDEAKPGNAPLTFELKLDPTHPYLATRGISPETIEAFGVGYCGRGLMKGRIAIPIHNENGELLAYAGRWAEAQVPESTPRYLLPTGFEKQSVLFNLHRLPAMEERTEPVVIVESYWSAMRVHELGFPVVSAMGHSVSPMHCELLAARNVRSVVVLFDGDEAGEEGLAESLAVLSRSFYVHAPRVPDGFKPHKMRPDELRTLIERARK